MLTVAIDEPRILSIEVSDDRISAELADGRTISVPLAWSWRLSDATPAQRANYEIIGTGEGVHWPDIDEDLSARGMLQGIPARLPSAQKEPRRTKRRSSSNNRRKPAGREDHNLDSGR